MCFFVVLFPFYLLAVMVVLVLHLFLIVEWMVQIFTMVCVLAKTLKSIRWTNKQTNKTNKITLAFDFFLLLMLYGYFRYYWHCEQSSLWTVEKFAFLFFLSVFFFSIARELVFRSRMQINRCNCYVKQSKHHFNGTK